MKRSKTLVKWLLALVATAVVVQIATIIGGFRAMEGERKALKEMGGSIVDKNLGPRFLRSLFGDESPFKVVEEVWSGTKATDEDLPLIASFKTAKAVVLNGSNVRGGNFSYLTNLTKLEYVSLMKSSVTDEGLQQLASIQTISALNLAYTRISDEGIGHLQELRGLKALNLEGTAVTDASLLLLKDLPLTELSIQKTLITTDGIRSFTNHNRQVRVAH